MQINRDKDCYALVQGVENHHGYGHIYVYVFNVLPGGQQSYNDVRLDATCQIGSGRDTPLAEAKSYAHHVGITSLMARDSLSLGQLKAGVKIMNKVDRYLDKMYDELGSPVDFADLATRVIRGAGAGTVHFMSNGSFEFDLRHQSVTMTTNGGMGYVRKRIADIERQLIERLHGHLR